MARLPGIKIKRETTVLAISNLFALARNVKTLSRDAQKFEIWLISQININDKQFEKYRITAEDTATMLKLTDSSYSYKKLSHISSELLSHVIFLKDGKKLKQFSLISSSTYHQGEGWCEIKIDPELKPYLLELKEKGRFSLLEVEISLSFNEKFSYPLYKVLKSYLYNNQTEYKIEIELIELKKILGCENKYSNYSHFKSYVIEPTRKDFIDKADILFMYKPSKKVRKRVVSLEFTISKNITSSAIDIKHSDIEDPLKIKLINLGWNGNFEELVKECGYQEIEYYYANFLSSIGDDLKIKFKDKERARIINTQILLNAKLVYKLKTESNITQKHKVESENDSNKTLFKELQVLGFSGDINAFIREVGPNNVKKALEDVKKAQKNSNITTPGGLLRSKANMYLKQEKATAKAQEDRRRKKEEKAAVDKQQLLENKEELKGVYKNRVEQGISGSEDEAFIDEFNIFIKTQQNEKRYLKDGTKLFDYLNNIKITTIDDFNDKDLSMFLDWKRR